MQKALQKSVQKNGRDAVTFAMQTDDAEWDAVSHADEYAEIRADKRAAYVQTRMQPQLGDLSIAPVVQTFL